MAPYFRIDSVKLICLFVKLSHSQQINIIFIIKIYIVKFILFPLLLNILIKFCNVRTIYSYLLVTMSLKAIWSEIILHNII